MEFNLLCFEVALLMSMMLGNCNKMMGGCLQIFRQLPNKKYVNKRVHYPLENSHIPLKINGWKMKIPFELVLFLGRTC